MKRIFTICILFSAFTVKAQTNLTYDKIRLAGAGNIVLVQSDKHTITLDDGEVPAQKLFTISDGWLTVNGKPGDDFIVTAPDISKIDIAGTGKLESESTIEVQNIELMVSGIGKIELNLKAENIDAIISGAGKMELNGTADNLTIDISGSGKIDGEDLTVKKCTASISGSGKSLIDVTESLDVSISGSGGVYYVNPPANINKNVSGMGKIGSANDNITDTTRISIGDKKILIIDDEGESVRLGFKDITGKHSSKVKSHWAGFEMGVNMLVDENFETDPPAGYEFLDPKIEKSIALNFNLADFEIKLYRRNIMLVTGIGFSINNFRFKSDAWLEPNADSVTAIVDPSVTLKKNKLVAEYINIPLLLEFNTSENRDRTVHLAAGVIGGLRIGSRVKMIQKKDGDESKVKIYDDFNLNPFRCDATVRVGFKNFTVFGSYGLLAMFKDNKGPELMPFTAGIRLVGW